MYSRNTINENRQIPVFSKYSFVNHVIRKKIHQNDYRPDADLFFENLLLCDKN